ncbi:hypothetical protein ACFV9W_07200 [Streptomyces sp. NPDC059897]|uniref:hypothetical protein n=1 Tax=Streptomyces sp. NPDC059897 TaxID=3346994 RepID=UPI003646549B
MNHRGVGRREESDGPSTILSPGYTLATKVTEIGKVLERMAKNPRNHASPTAPA